MPILNFNKKFASKVKRGLKTQTIRRFRKFPIKPGDKLYLYTGLRTKYAKKLREAICIDTEIIRIDHDGIERERRLRKSFFHEREALNRFAKSDGFKDWNEMLTWWLKVHGLPFEGTLISWK